MKAFENRGPLLENYLVFVSLSKSETVFVFFGLFFVCLFFVCFVPFCSPLFCPFTVSLVFNVYSWRDSRTLSTLVKLRIIVSLLIQKKMNPLPCFFPDVCSKLLYLTFLIVILRIRLQPVAPFCILTCDVFIQ